jgi:hypothetical protein
MTKHFSILIASIALAASVHAQDSSSGVTTSTDPATAAAVEQAARDMKARSAQDANAGTPGSSAAVVQDKTEGGLAFLSGGITVGDRVSMHAQRANYSFWVTTVAKPSGAYLSDAKLQIVNRKDKTTVLDRTMDGPWFLIALPAGSYDVSATYTADGSNKPQTLSTRVSVPAKGQRQAVLRFDSTATVSPDMQSPFNGNPFGAPQAMK